MATASGSGPWAPPAARSSGVLWGEGGDEAFRVALGAQARAFAERISTGAPATGLWRPTR
jgi:hypothetical protein